MTHPATEAAMSPWGNSTTGEIVRTKRKQSGYKPIALPSYDTGTDFVPEDQVALIHRGEQVVPAEENPHALLQGMKPLAPAEKPAGIGHIEMNPNSMEPATISTQELGVTKPKELISTEEKEAKPTTGGTVVADRWLKRNGLAAPAATDSAIPQGVTAPKGFNQGGPGLKPIQLPDTTTAPAATSEAIPTGRAAYKAKIAEYDKQHQDLMNKAAETNDSQYTEQAARVTEAKLAYEKQHPWGSPESAHPGILGKLGHIGEMIAARTPFFGINAITSTIPGSEVNRAGQERAAEEQVKEAATENAAVEKDTPEQKTARALLEKGYTIAKDEKGNIVLNEIPGFRDSSKDMQALLASTVQDVVANGGDPNTDPTVQRITKVMQSLQKPEKPEKPVEDFATFYPKWLKDHPTAKDNSHNEALALKEFHEASQAPPQVLLMQPNAEGGQTATVVKPGTTVGNEATKPGEVATASRKDIAAHDKAYVQPANAVEKSYDMMDHAYQEYEAARAQGKDLPTGAQSMVALSTHLSTTFGNVKGARITKDMIQEHLGARGVSDKALVAFQKLSNGDVLSPDQWEAFHNLIAESRKLSWQTAVKEAERKHIPINFLPDDLTAVKVPGNAASTIHTSQLQDFQKKYPNGVVLSEKE